MGLLLGEKRGKIGKEGLSERVDRGSPLGVLFTCLFFMLGWGPVELSN